MRYPLSLLDKLKPKQEITCDENKTMFNLDGFLVKSYSKRFGAFKESQECYICGLKADHFEIDIAINKDIVSHHLNMYSEDGTLFTAAHLIPLSKGGKTIQSNLKTCCEHCANKKGNKWNTDLQ